MDHKASKPLIERGKREKGEGDCAPDAVQPTRQTGTASRSSFTCFPQLTGLRARELRGEEENAH